MLLALATLAAYSLKGRTKTRTTIGGFRQNIQLEDHVGDTFSHFQLVGMHSSRKQMNIGSDTKDTGESQLWQ